MRIETLGAEGVSTSDAPEVVILLALHNGRENLGAQLDSFAAQDHQNWSLTISDDGRPDGARDIVSAFADAYAEHKVQIQTGPRQGFAMNFISLLTSVPASAGFAALSDQDDVWLPGKLSRALSQLAVVPDSVPALYVGRTMICDAALRPLRPSPLFTRTPGFRNAMVQSLGGGNTMVLNPAAVDLVARVASRLSQLVAHDWWLYQLVTGVGGQIVYDPVPQVLYRQHEANLIGANDNPGAARRRVKSILRGQFREWIGVSIEAMTAAEPWLTDDARQVLSELSQARRSHSFARMSALRRSGVYRQSARDNLALYVSAFLGKL